MRLKYITRPFEVKEVGDEGRVTGHGSVFGDLDSYRDIVLPGAFAKTLAEKKAQGKIIPMLWQHNSSEPVGGWDSFSESEKGLDLGGDLVMEVQRGREAHALTKAKVVTGLSIGYNVPKGGSSYDDKKNITYLKEIDLWEVSLVTFPANESAQIDHVRHKMARGEELTIRELETVLRDAGLSRVQVKKLLARAIGEGDQRDADAGIELLTTMINTLKA